MKSLARRYLIRFIFHFLVMALSHQEVLTSDSMGYLSEDQSSTRFFFYKHIEYGKDCHEIQNLYYPSNTSGVYFIQPEGYLTPFEVFCDNSDGSAGWTVIHRRKDGSLDFMRNWTEYRNGFGFPSSEFWLGNDKLSYLTNQQRYELQIEIENAEGATYHINYNMFRISDKRGEYMLTRLGKYCGNADEVIEMCPSNTVYGACVCQATCDKPADCHKNCVDGEETCICPAGYFLYKDDKCVLQQECGCYVDGYGVVPNAGKYVNSNCSRECFCNDNLLTCNDYFQCHSNATCQEVDGIHQCRCKDAFEGNGQTCIALPTDCMELYNAGNTADGVYTIYPKTWSGSKFNVYCDMTTDGGGWTIFQRRINGSVTFYQTWPSYKMGFGEQTGEHWLGNDKIHSLTHSKNNQLRIDLVDSGGRPYHALYDLFRINDENDKYRLVNLGSFTGTAGHDSMASNHNKRFSTHDQDNSGSIYKAAEKHEGAWWYHETRTLNTPHCHTWTKDDSYLCCSFSNLNGNYSGGRANNVFWYELPGNDCLIRQTEMKIRPI